MEEARQVTLGQIMRFRRLHLKRLLPAEYEYFAEWYHAVIREILPTLPDSNVPSSHVAQLLIPEISARDAEKSMLILQRLGLIVKNGQGLYSQGSSCLTTGLQWDNAVIAAFQMKMGELGVQAIQKIPKQERDISTLTVSLTEEGFGRVKALLKSVRDAVLLEAKEGGDRVFQINFQIFPVSKKPKE